MAKKISRLDLQFLKNCVESVQAEFEQLELDYEWFVNDLSDLLCSSQEIIITALHGEDIADGEEEQTENSIY